MAVVGMLQFRTTFPESLLSCAPEQVHDILGGPTLFHLAGQRMPPLFVTVLQHGNEPTGFQAVQAIIKKYAGTPLPRAVWLFVANTKAASLGKRSLEAQPDFNRCWPGHEVGPSAESNMMEEVVRRVTGAPLFASIDLHNNTGCNPHYGCVNKLDHRFLHLATLFSRTVVYFTRPKGVQSLAMASHGPSVTVECGQAGQLAALDHAISFLDACLHLHHLPDQPVHHQDIHLLHTMATVKVRPGVDFGFEKGANVLFRSDLDHFNFGLIKAGQSLAFLNDGATLPLEALDNDGRDITANLFNISGGELVAVRPIIPSMATTNADVIRQDCLFYVMEEIELTQ